MSNEEIAGNKLIMDFMKIQEKETCYEDGIGWVTRHYKTCNELHCTRACGIKGDSYNMFLEDSKYHFSWDWLMPVIEKIYKIIPKNKNIELPLMLVMVTENNKFLFRLDMSNTFEADTVIESAWMAVVDYIKSLNIMLNKENL